MTSITGIPCEIVAAILGSLDHLRFLSAAVLSCRHFYLSFKEDSHGIQVSIIRNQITPALIPYAVALVDILGLDRPFIDDTVSSLLAELYDFPARLAARLPMLSLPLLRKMGRTHDAIHTMAMDFATTAWDRVVPGYGTAADALSGASSSPKIALSALEHFHFFRAFYRVELYNRLFTDCYLSELFIHDSFLLKHPPWENEQVGAVAEYLEAKFAEASHEVVAHDVMFGAAAIDYLVYGPSNEWRQFCLCRGVEFVCNVATAESYDTKLSMLQPLVVDGPIPERRSLAYDLQQVRYELSSPGSARTIEEFCEEELSAGLPRANIDDRDRGPYEAWYQSHKRQLVQGWLMYNPFDDQLRQRAYVFWDWDRVQERLRCRPVWGPPALQDVRYHTQEDFAEMEDSWLGRSIIWDRGGQGYWSKGDTSRVWYH